MKNNITLFITISILAILSLCGFTMNKEEVSTDEDKINWVTIEEAEALQKKQKRPIYIDVYTTWCGPCKLMSSKTFTNKKVIEMMNSKFYAVKFDAESKKPLKFVSSLQNLEVELTYHCSMTIKFF